MDKKTRDILLEMTRSGYETIATAFSGTRNRGWDDLKVIHTVLTHDTTVLDVGCGNGRLFDEIKGEIKQYIGIDRSEGLISQANTLHKDDIQKPLFEVQDIARTENPLPQNNLSLCIAVLAHIPSRDLQLKVLKLIYDALLPGGTLVMTNWNLWRPTLKQKSVWKYAFEKFKTSGVVWKEKYAIEKQDIGIADCLTQWNGNGQTGVLYYYAFTPKELNSLLHEAGFVDVESKYVLRGEVASWNTAHNILSVGHKSLSQK
jgi:SAM-dependent methyltransferase